MRWGAAALTATAPSMRRATVLSAASFGVLGACLTLPGTLLPVLVDALGLRLVEAGSMLALQPAGYLIAVLVATPLIRRVGIRAVLAAGLVVSGAAFAGFGGATGWVSGGAPMFVSGLGFGVMEVATNTLLILGGGARRANVLNLAHLFFGVGSFLAPVLATRAVAAGASWRLVFAGAGALTAAVGASWSLLDARTGAPEPAAPRAVPSRLALLLATLIGVYVGVEVGVGGWLTKYLVSVRGLSLADAGAALSLYWLGLSVGRLVLGMLAHRLRDETALLGLTLLACAALAAALMAPSVPTAVLAFAVTGVGLSGIFPAVMALGGRQHLDDPARMTSVLVAGAGAGGVVLPWTMSAVAERAGLTAGMACYVAGAAAMVALTVAVRRRLRR